ncbi:(R,S)-reticuline 7-O-methyltransferase [Elaeis guineensis]|uniref:(R,S)-reticuline 7-O-methyltransferase n=1 Tax=Elaeis guineensis var. tenera TaxID=51953 RepID=UPI003C6D3929
MEDDDSVLEGQTWVWQTMLAFADSMVLRCAVELGIADIIHEHGKPLSLPHLASLLPSPPPNPTSLLRIMRFLTHKKIFSTHSHPETGETLYGLTPASRVLVRSSDLSLGPVVLYGTHPFPIAAWHSFSASVLQGGTPYIMAHGTDMLSGTAATNPEFNAVFQNAMACPAKGILDAGISVYRDGFAGLDSLVDVGGGTGATLGEIVKLHPGTKGINFDLPHVIERAPEYPGVTHVAGDMFKTIPPADAVFMKRVMHCFGDEECEKVLRNCRSVIPEKTGKVIIVDVVLYPDDNSPLGDIRTKFDMLMFAYKSTGKERTEEEWKKLLKASGFPRWNIIRIPAIWSIIEAFPE